MAIIEMESQKLNEPEPGMSLARRESLWGYAFISPWLVGFLLLTLVPMIATFIFTFTKCQSIFPLILASFVHLFNPSYSRFSCPPTQHNII